MSRIAILLAVVLTAMFAQAKIFLHEPFDNLDAWVQSEHKSDFGKCALSSGDFFGDEAINKGMKLTQDAHFYAISRPLTTPATNDKSDIVVSIQVKHEQGLDCGGGYVKLLPDFSPKSFHGESSYWMMFGPDKCGYTNKVHIIFNYKGNNLLWKKEPRYPDDKLTHVYTVVVKHDNTYEFYLDQEKKESGSLEEDWKFLEPKEIDDPEDKKPSDWVDDPEMDDPSDKKPADWDNEPAEIADPEAKKPEDWDSEQDGEWEAPMIPNPNHKGAWHPKRIPNPAYKGTWKPKQIANPKYAPDDKLYKIPTSLKYVGIDVWQVKSGTIFDNIIIGDSLDEVNAIVDKTWKATKDAEKKAEEDKNKKASEDSAAKDDSKDKADDDDKEDL